MDSLPIGRCNGEIRLSMFNREPENVQNMIKLWEFRNGSSTIALTGAIHNCKAYQTRLTPPPANARCCQPRRQVGERTQP